MEPRLASEQEVLVVIGPLSIFWYKRQQQARIFGICQKNTFDIYQVSIVFCRSAVAPRAWAP